MGHRILIIDIPSSGHVFPKLALVEELVGSGNQVTYVTVDEFSERVEARGATVLNYESVKPLERLDAGHRDVPPVVFLEENAAMLKAIREYFGERRPDLIAYDEAAFQAGRVLADIWELPAVQLMPSVASNEHFSYFDKMLEITGGGFEIADPVDEVTDFLAEYGLAAKVDEFLWSKRGPEEFNIVFVPRQFQNAQETFDERFVFVGPSLGDRSFLGDWKVPKSNFPIILVSLGTVNNKHVDFFRTAIEVFAEQPLYGVISIGTRVDPAALGPLPSNVEIHRWVSHLSVLEHASAFVTHGGTGSVSEALYSGTPMVVVPQGIDVLPYAERVVELGVGKVVNQEEVNVERLRAAVVEVAHDEGIRMRTLQLQQHTRESGGARRAANEIVAYLNRVTS
ncbi:putative Uncharacterized UDP-glucosyltransferase YjiC [Frankia sp. Hr75.2]|nr:putative Uncharacterized UDP-glucosyltransferase YjiC [Frankia sp. Hr75.2]